jgi:hypothetical protein
MIQKLRSTPSGFSLLCLAFSISWVAAWAYWDPSLYEAKAIVWRKPSSSLLWCGPSLAGIALTCAVDRRKGTTFAVRMHRWRFIQWYAISYSPLKPSAHTGVTIG